jgi:hypothetical protein
MTVAIAREIRTVDLVSKRGQRLLSINLAGLDVAELWQATKALGFTPELIHLRFGPDLVQAHALLWEGPIGNTPANLDEKLDELWDRYDSAVHYATGQSQAEYLASAGGG